MRVAIATLGCKVNQYDTAVMERLFDEKGWSRVPFEDEADAYVVNSCTVTDRADSDARRLARRARRTNPDSRVIMTGCYAQTSPDEVANLEYVDYVIGLGRLSGLLDAVSGELKERQVVADLRHADTVETIGITSFSGRSRAFVKVQEGCNLFCTFCIVPVARGRSRSVAARTVVEEIERLSARGFREVVLTGVHLGGYGQDLEPSMDLAGLLECIGERNLPVRVRVSSVDPPEITDRFLAAASSIRGLCPHFHIPLQAGHDTVLERMGRKYTVAEAEAALALLRQRDPDIAIGTDLITGFPGESDEDFEAGLAWVAELELAYLHVFPYSKRTATSAAKRWPELEEGLVHRRARSMRELDQRLRHNFRQRFFGRSVQVLVEGKPDAETGMLHGYSQHYVPVAFEGSPELTGHLIEVTLSDRITGNRVFGEVA